MALTEIITKLDKIEEMLSNQAEKPLSIDEAFAYMHISKSYLYKLTCKRQIPYYKPNGKLIYFKKSDLDSWIFRSRQATDEELNAEVELLMKRKK